MKFWVGLLIGMFVLVGSAQAEIRVAGRKVVASAGTEEAIATTSTRYTHITICAESDNTGIMAIGGNPVVAAVGTSATGVFLAASDCYTPPNTLGYRYDLKNIYVDATVSGDGVTYEYILEN